MTASLPTPPTKACCWRGDLTDEKPYDSALKAYAAETESWLANRMHDKDLRHYQINGVQAGQLLRFMVLNMREELIAIGQTAKQLAELD